MTLDAYAAMADISGKFRIRGLKGRDEDLIAFTPTRLGRKTRGTWEKYFDGSDVDLRTYPEDVWGTWIDGDSGGIYLTTRGPFSVPGASGNGMDIFKFDPVSLGKTTDGTFSAFWNGADNGFSHGGIDGLSIDQ